MRYEKGGSLGQLLYGNRKKNVSFPGKIHILMHIAEAIRSLHSINGVHGDLKPQNILLTEGTDPQIRLADFGLSQIRQEQNIDKNN
jgi:serine/threonine protein kinase